jgi:hypothetical protein
MQVAVAQALQERKGFNFIASSLFRADGRSGREAMAVFVPNTRHKHVDIPAAHTDQFKLQYSFQRCTTQVPNAQQRATTHQAIDAEENVDCIKSRSA